VNILTGAVFFQQNAFKYAKRCNTLLYTIMKHKIKSVKLTTPKKNASSIRKLEYIRTLAILESTGIKVEFTEEKITSLKNRFISKLKIK
jgi:hypothetical protein